VRILKHSLYIGQRADVFVVICQAIWTSS